MFALYKMRLQNQTKTPEVNICLCFQTFSRPIINSVRHLHQTTSACDRSCLEENKSAHRSQYSIRQAFRREEVYMCVCVCVYVLQHQREAFFTLKAVCNCNEFNALQLDRSQLQMRSFLCEFSCFILPSSGCVCVCECASQGNTPGVIW